MLEILGIVLLCNINKKNAKMRGKKPGGYIGLTIGLWIGMEIIGAAIGTVLQLGLGVYVLAIAFALIGGFASWYISKNVNTAPTSKTCDNNAYDYKQKTEVWHAVKSNESVIHEEEPSKRTVEDTIKHSQEPEERLDDTVKESYKGESTVQTQLGKESFPAHTMTAVWFAAAIAGSWVPILIMHVLFREVFLGSNIVYNTRVPFLISYIMLGIGVYLMLQRERLYKWISIGVFTTSMIISAFSSIAYKSLIVRYSLGSYYLTEQVNVFDGFGRALGSAMLSTIAACGLALLFDYLWSEKEEKRRICKTGWIAAAGVLLADIICAELEPKMGANVTTSEASLNIIIGHIAGAAALALTVLFLYIVCVKKEKIIKLRGWPFVWCILCSLGMFSSLFITFAPNQAYSMQILFSIAALVGFIMLLCHRRLGFFIITAGAFVSLLSQFLASSDGITYGALYGTTYYASAVGESVTMFTASLSGVLTIIITWISIQRSWRESALGYNFELQNKGKCEMVPVFPKAAAIINLVLCSLAFIISLGMLISLNFQTVFSVSMVLSMTGISLSICAIPSLFSKYVPYKQWMNILMQVMFFVICSVILSILLVNIFNSIVLPK
ncbi:MAG: hypothetical protein GX663_02810 [Clostridiales bacterium]|nr:hypothetical protein [Clostridiales bacterium]